MRVMVTGGSRFDPAIGADLYRLGFNILQGYGLTETSGAATLTRPNDPALETVGQPLPGNEVRIAPPEAGADAEAGADGEVLIRGPIVMQGYFNRPDATAAALRDGWLYTGDLGRLDARGAAVDHRPQEGADRPQLRQEHLPGGDRGGLPQVGLHQGTVRARARAARRAGRRAPVRRRRARRPGAARQEDRQRRRYPPLRDGRRLGQPAASQACARLRESGWSRCRVRRPARSSASRSSAG